MNIWSVSFTYRLGLGFHALNNEGADGSNLMQPRRIDVGNVTYDGISGEIIRRHVLENFVRLCQADDNIRLLPLSAGLHPDRGPIGIRAAAKARNHGTLANENLFQCARYALALCAVIDVGGFLAAWQDQPADAYISERDYLTANCAPLSRSERGSVEVQPLKRESCFDVAWLISESPQDLTVTQHSAFRDTFTMNSRYAQTMRSNIYGGVIRADLHRIGTDDYWYLQTDGDGRSSAPRLAISEDEQRRRQIALVNAIANFIASPTGARVAGWAPHVFLTEGAVLLSSTRTAPFTSPIKVDLSDQERPVQFNSDYSGEMQKLHNDNDTWCWQFKDSDGLSGVIGKIAKILGGKDDGESTAN